MNAPPLPWARPDRRRSPARGWLDLTNRRASLTVGETTFAFAGVDDPHLGYDRLDEVAGPADPTADVRLGVAHAPYLRVLDQYAADGYDAVLAGHTHGGQVCLPGGRRADHQLRPRAGAGPRPAPPPGRLAPGDPGSAWLHVSAGLGTSPYARIRVACRPEATLLTLVPREARRPEYRLGRARGARVCSPLAAHRHIGLWRSLVARLVRDEEAAGSNPVSPTL